MSNQIEQLTPEEFAEFERQLNAGRLRAVNAKELLSMQIPPREYVLEPIIHTQSTNMLFSKRGVGKTYTSLGIAYAVAAGATFLRWRAPKPRKVLYVDGEMPAVTMQQRFAAIVAGMDSECDPSFFRLITPDLQTDPMPSVSSTNGQTLVEDQLGDSELIILDNISTLTTGGRENEAESWLPVQQWVLSLRRRGVSVLLIHHAGRNGEQRGTSRREDILDTMITLRHPEDYNPADGARFQVHFTKARNIHGADAEPFEVRMHEENGAAIWTMSSIADVTEARVHELLNEGRSFREIAKELNIGKSTVERIKGRMK
jgi:putative DNA primase/helicase